MALVTWRAGGKTGVCEVDTGTTLMEVLRRENVPLDFPCGGNHSCGKCRVVVDGGVDPLTEKERQLLGDAPVGIRLACFARVAGDCTVTVETARGSAIATDHFESDGDLTPLYDGDYGVAIDIGTTTIAAYLFSCHSKKPLAVCGEMNDQGRYGADVLTRIDYAAQNGVGGLQECICEQLGRMMAELCHNAGIDPAQLSGACITGNTTMLHLLTGLDPYSLSQAPFTPQSLFGHYEKLPIPGFSHLKCYLPRCISAYVGADITCSILASELLSKKGNVLMVDIGTNGEMALKSGERLLCCATAAGPAFEGAGISCGGPASEGAVSKVWLEEGKFVCSVLGGGEGKSICGSGLIDAIACMLENKTIEYRGRFPKGAEPFAALTGNVRITLADVRQVQLAKGAIRGGIDTLLDAAGLTPEQLDGIILCGGFGSFLDPRSAEIIGLIPAGTAAKTTAIGNGAGTGAGWMLQSAQQVEESLRFVERAELIELSTSEVFKTQYIQAMNFPK